MDIKYCNKPFSEIKNGGIFVCSHKSENLVMKISPCKESERNMNAVRLEDGKLFYFNEADAVYPVNCFIMRNA